MLNVQILSKFICDIHLYMIVYLRAIKTLPCTQGPRIHSVQLIVSIFNDLKNGPVWCFTKSSCLFSLGKCIYTCSNAPNYGIARHSTVQDVQHSQQLWAVQQECQDSVPGKLHHLTTSEICGTCFAVTSVISTPFNQCVHSNSRLYQWLQMFRELDVKRMLRQSEVARFAHINYIHSNMTWT